MGRYYETTTSQTRPTGRGSGLMELPPPPPPPPLMEQKSDDTIIRSRSRTQSKKPMRAAGQRGHKKRRDSAIVTRSKYQYSSINRQSDEEDQCPQRARRGTTFIQSQNLRSWKRPSSKDIGDNRYNQSPLILQRHPTPQLGDKLDLGRR